MDGRTKDGATGGNPSMPPVKGGLVKLHQQKMEDMENLLQKMEASKKLYEKKIEVLQKLLQKKIGALLGQQLRGVKCNPKVQLHNTQL